MKFFRKPPADPDPQQKGQDLPDEVPTNAFEAAWPFNSDSPLVAGLLDRDRFISILLVDVTGLDWEAIAGHLPTIRDIADSKRMVPVLVVDLLDYRDLVAEGLAYDTLPNLAANEPLCRELDWTAYLAWRRHLLTEKWRPSAVVNLGPNADWDAP